MIIEIYSKDDCPYCVRAKDLLDSKGFEYTEYKIGLNISREEFLDKYPDAKTVPQIVIDGIRIGGFDRLKDHFT